MRRVMLAVGLFAAVAAGPVHAAEEADRGLLGVTAKVGTLGYGGDLTLGLGRYLSVRGGYNQMKFDHDVSMDEADITGELDWQTIPVLLDVYPFGSGFRISGGVVRNDNQVLLSAAPGETLRLAGYDFPVERLDGRMTFDRTSYYAGFGYGAATGMDGRWHFSCDFGVLFHGEPQVDATATASDPRLQSALDAALEVELNDYRDDIHGFKYYPVISFGISLRI